MDRRILVVTILLLMSCSPVVVKKELQETPEQATEENIPIMPETSQDVQTTYLDSINRNKEIGLVDSDFGSTIHPTIIQTVEQTGNGMEIRYRIQIFASSSVESLRDQKKMIEKKVNLPFYLTFEPPFYKLFVGDFQIRSEAEATLPKIKKYGFTDAWIVTAKSIPAN